MVSVSIDMTAIKALRPAASARGMTPAALVQSIVEVVAREGLADAVLDDR
jgi:hypothetical protein